MQEQETKETDHQPSGGHAVNSSSQSSNYGISNSIEIQLDEEEIVLIDKDHLEMGPESVAEVKQGSSFEENTVFAANSIKYQEQTGQPEVIKTMGLVSYDCQSNKYEPEFTICGKQALDNYQLDDIGFGPESVDEEKVTSSLEEISDLALNRFEQQEQTGLQSEQDESCCSHLSQTDLFHFDVESNKYEHVHTICDKQALDNYQQDDIGDQQALDNYQQDDIGDQQALDNNQHDIVHFIEQTNKGWKSKVKNIWMSYYNPWTKDTMSLKEERERRNKQEKVKREHEEAEERKKEQNRKKREEERRKKNEENDKLIQELELENQKIIEHKRLKLMEELKKDAERYRKENEQRELELENEKFQTALLRKMKFEASMKAIEDARAKVEEKKINDQKKHALEKQQQVKLRQKIHKEEEMMKKEKELMKQEIMKIQKLRKEEECIKEKEVKERPLEETERVIVRPEKKTVYQIEDQIRKWQQMREEHNKKMSDRKQKYENWLKEHQREQEHQKEELQKQKLLQMKAARWRSFWTICSLCGILLTIMMFILLPIVEIQIEGLDEMFETFLNIVFPPQELVPKKFRLEHKPDL